MTVAVVEIPDEDAAEPLPCNVAAEAQMLSAVLVLAQSDTPAAHALVDDLAAMVEPGDLWRTDHALVWQTMIEASALGLPLDPAAVGSRILASGAPVARQAAQRTLPALMGAMGSPASAVHHATEVARVAAARRFIEAGHQAVQRGYAPGFDPAIDLPEVVGRLELAAGRQHGSPSVTVGSVVEQALDLMENPERVDVIPSGLFDLDLLYPGLRPGQLVVIGARPSIGKSVFGLTLAAEAAVRLGYPTALFSAEMTRLEVTQRLICARATVDLGKVLAGTLDPSEWDKVARHLKAITEAPLWIDDTSDLTVAHIRAEVRRLARKGLRAVVIDYLQLITLAKSESRQVGVDEVARQLKVLAGDVGVPIVLLSQLNRGPEQRHDKRPMMSDLRESGGIENHADVVMLLNRPDFYNGDDRPGECDLIVAKHRNGRTGTATVAFQGHYARMSSMATWAMDR